MFFGTRCYPRKRDSLAQKRDAGMVLCQICMVLDTACFVFETAFVLASCDFQAGAAEVHFVYFFHTAKLRLSSEGCGIVYYFVLKCLRPSC